MRGAAKCSSRYNERLVASIGMSAVFGQWSSSPLFVRLLYEKAHMTRFRSTILASAMIAFSLGMMPLMSSTSSAQTCSAQTAPDNSAKNKSQTTTADNQNNSKADRMTTAQVRKAIIADKDLSLYAHNVKIIVLDGNVTLKGPVKSEGEKSKVAADVANVVSADKISNKLTVKQ